MKKVLFLTNIPSPYRVKFFDELASYCDVTVFLTEPQEGYENRNASWYIQGEGKFTLVNPHKRIALPGGQVLCPEVISWLRKPFDYIVIHGYAYPTFILAETWLKLHRHPFFMEVDGGMTVPESGLKRGIKTALIQGAERYFSTGAVTDAFLMHYGAQKERLLFYPFSSLKRENILESIVSAEEKASLRRELGIAEEKVVLAVGQFIHRKGFDVLLRAASRLMPGTGIYFVGGEPTEEYRALAQSAGCTGIHFVSFVNQQTLEKYYKAADVFALPTREDIWGLVINEAMAYGLPVVTTDRCVAGMELIRDGENGYIVPVEEEALLAQRLNEVLSGDTEAMGAKALEAIRPYTIEEMARIHADVFA